MSEERNSTLKLWVAASDMTRFCVNLGLLGLSLRISSFTRHGKWSEILLIIIDEEMFVWSKCYELQTIWSMRVQDFFELRVGRVILGKKLLVHIRSKNSSNFSLSFICKRFILKSPTIAAYLFSFWSVLIIDKFLDIGIIVVVVWWFVNVADSNRPAKILTWDFDEETLPDIRLGIITSKLICIYFVEVYDQPRCLVHLLPWWIN